MQRKKITASANKLFLLHDMFFQEASAILQHVVCAA